MQESKVFSTSSLIDISKDIISSSSGVVSTSDKTLILEPNSEATYVYTFDTTDNILKSSNLRLNLNVENSNKEVISRYSEEAQVELSIKYYKENIDESGESSGYIEGNLDNFQVNPYFNHETTGYIREYDLDITEQPLMYLEIKFINTSETNTVSFINPKIYNSMSVIDAIKEYGGQGGGGGGGTGSGDIPKVNDLTVYSLSDNYVIDKHKGSLYLRCYIPPKYYEGLSSKQIRVKWTFTKLSGSPSYRTITYNYEYEVLPTEESTVAVKYTAYEGELEIYSTLQDGTFKARAEITDPSTGAVIYDEKTISIINNNFKTLTLEVGDAEGKIRGTQGTKCKIKLDDASIRNEDNNSSYSVRVAVEQYDTGFAMFNRVDAYNYNSITLKIFNNEAEFILYGNADGKVKITINTLETSNIKPVKSYEYILDVVECNPTNITLSADKYIIKNHSDIVNLSITNNTLAVMSPSSSYLVVESIDGGKIGNTRYSGALTRANLSSNGSIIEEVMEFPIFGLDKGKVRLKVETSNEFSGTIKTYTSNTIEIDITFEDEGEIGGTLESSTGVYEITQGSGQITLTPNPNYTWYGDYSFSKMSVDGGDCTISSQTVGGKRVCLITAVKNGTVRITATPTYGITLVQDINITGQSPENVTLQVDTGTTRMLINQTLTIRAVPSNNPTTSNYRFRWAWEKVNVDNANISATTTDNSTAYRVTGRELGKILVRCLNYDTYALLGTIELEVVDTLE